MEARFGATQAVQQEVALGAKQLHGIDDHRFRHLDAGFTSGNVTRRPRGNGDRCVHRHLLDFANFGRCVLFFAYGLAARKAIRDRAYFADDPIFLPGFDLYQRVCLEFAAALTCPAITRGLPVLPSLLRNRSCKSCKLSTS